MRLTLCGTPRSCVLIAAAIGLLSGCGSSDYNNTPPTPVYSVGGQVSGLSGAGLVLQNNGVGTLAVTANGGFTIASAVTNGTAYRVSVNSQPSNPSQTCGLANSAGTVADASVTNITVTCTTNSYTVGGSVAGLLGAGLVLQNNSGNDLSVTANGSFTFSSGVTSGTTYGVTVRTQPTNPVQTCTVANPSGTIAGTAIGNVAVTCTTETYAVGGSVSGLSGSGLVLQNNARDDVSISADGGYTFPTQIPSGLAYTITVKTQPVSPAQTCTLANAIGTASANVANVTVTCVTDHLAYVADFTSSTILGFSVNSFNGALKPMPGSPFPVAGGTPAVLVIDPTQKFLYATNYQSKHISAYMIDATTGVLTESPGSTYPIGATPLDIAINPASGHLYVTSVNSNSISAFSIDATTGALSPLSGFPFTTVDGTPLSIAVDPAGEFAYVAVLSDYVSPGYVAVYSIDSATGALAAVSGSPFTAGVAPGYLALDPDAQFAYVSNPNSDNISAYAISESDGTLTQVPGSPFASTSVEDIVIEPSGKVLFAIHNSGTANRIDAYLLDSTTGALTFSAARVTPGELPRDIAVDPTGRFLYVANSISRDITAYSIDTTNGVLVEIPGAPFAAGDSPWSIVLR